MSFFSFCSHALIGLDIGAHTLRIAQLRKSKTGWVVSQMAVKTFTENIVADCKIKNWPALGAHLKEFVKELELIGSAVSLQIPAHLVRMQRIKLAKDMRGPDIEAEIYAQVERDLPGSHEALAIDYQIIKKCDDYTDIFFAAAKQTYISQYIMCINGAGLRPKIVDVDIFALRRAISFSLALESRANEQIILYVNDEVATLFACCDETITFLKHWEVLSPVAFLQEFKSHLEICIASVGHVDRLIICAEKHLSSLIADDLSNRFIIDCPDPFYHGKLSLAKSIDESFAQTHAQAFLLAFGLSMRECPKW